MNDYTRIAQAIQFVEDHFQDQPDLKTIADHVGLSEYHFQRLFKQWAGISPKRFLQYVTAEYAKALLSQSHSVLDATYEAGLSGPGRLHDLTVNIHAMTPGELSNHGAGLTIRYGFHDTPFGECLIAMTERGVCALRFVDDQTHAAMLVDLQSEWANAHFQEDPIRAGEAVRQIFEDRCAALHIRGTNFQVRVWEALLKIPPGQVSTYGDIAQFIGEPKASRAVGTAVGSNPVAYLIPCHRVIRKSGAFGGYHWGITRKKAIIGWEAARLMPEPQMS